MPEDSAYSVDVIAGVQEKDKLHWVLLTCIEVIKITFNLPNEILQVLNPDIWLVIYIDTIDVVTKDDSICDVYLISGKLECVHCL